MLKVAALAKVKLPAVSLYTAPPLVALLVVNVVAPVTVLVPVVYNAPPLVALLLVNVPPAPNVKLDPLK